MDLQKIKTLLDFVGRSRVSELTVSEAGMTVVIRNSSRAPAVGEEAPLQRREAPSLIQPATVADQARARLVNASLTGVVHQSHNPGSAPLVAVGDLVETGQALCIVEAMKVFTTVTAPFGGVVKRIFFEDGQEIGFGDPLVEIG